jgi:hypothetical protein
MTKIPVFVRKGLRCLPFTLLAGIEVVGGVLLGGVAGDSTSRQERAQGALHRSGFPKKEMNPNCAKELSLGIILDSWL